MLRQGAAGEFHQIDPTSLGVEFDRLGVGATEYLVTFANEAYGRPWVGQRALLSQEAMDSDEPDLAALELGVDQESTLGTKSKDP